MVYKVTNFAQAFCSKIINFQRILKIVYLVE